jgi:hypothetical protein
MDVLELKGPHGWLRIQCHVVSKEASPIAAKGLQHLHYAVGGQGFSGEADGFVAEDELRDFCKALVVLADGGHAEANIAGYKEGGLSVRVQPDSDPGCLSIEGQIVRQSFRKMSEKDGIYTWATQFGFWVERDRLSGLRQVRWVLHFISS